MKKVLPSSNSVMITNLVTDPSNLLSPEEWIEMENLKDIISYNPANVSTDKMERFTELYVRSILGKGENTHVIHSYNKK
jgi:hypothetical protein